MEYKQNLVFLILGNSDLVTTHFLNTFWSYKQLKNDNSLLSTLWYKLVHGNIQNLILYCTVHCISYNRVEGFWREKSCDTFYVLPIVVGHQFQNFMSLLSVVFSLCGRPQKIRTVTLNWISLNSTFLKVSHATKCVL